MNPSVGLADKVHSGDQALGRLIDELTAKVQAGDSINVEAYIDAHPEHAEALRRLLPALQLLADLGRSAAVGSGGGAEASGVPDGLTGALGDFRIVREVGRGGMGVVYEAEQLSLRRRVALKMLPFAATLDATQLQRFKNEAQAAAHLQHQHIVPVYAVGCERGVYYYAMQFIDGQTLAAVIAELRQQARPSAGALTDAPPAAPADLVDTRPPAGLLTERSIRSAAYVRGAAHLGVQAAEALEHAHQLGVVHRDIKPANLLVDGRRNLWITDFGLAHCQGQPELTVTGDRLGTARYMSPEQASRQRGLLDHRTDLYSLGVTLYELLTLEPVCTGGDWPEIQLQIVLEEPRPPRRLNPAIPADLETIVLKALAKEPEGRYATAQELADDLRRFLEDRPIQARRPTLRERARKWARRHKTVVRSAVVVLVLAMVSLAVSTALITAAYNAEIEQRCLAQANAKEAEAQRQRAEERTRQTRRAVDMMYTQVAQKWLANQPKLTALQREFLLEALKVYQELAQDSSTDPGVRHETARLYGRVGDIQKKLGQRAEAKRAYEQAIATLRLLADKSPEVADYRRDLAGGYNNLGNLLQHSGKLREAEAAYRDALALQKQLAADSPAVPQHRHELAGSHSNLGVLLAAAGRPQEAEAAYGDALALQKQLAADSPTVPEYRQGLAQIHNNLGVLLAAAGRPQEAEAAYRDALALRKQLAADSPNVPAYRHELAYSHLNLGVLLAAAGRPQEAEAAYGDALALQKQLAADSPTVPEYRHLLARSHLNLGVLLAAAGRPQEAEAAYGDALALQKQLAADSPNVPAYQQDLALSHNNLAVLLEAMGRPQEAEAAYRAALPLQQRLATAFPTVPEYRHELARSQNNLAWLLTTCSVPQCRDPVQAIDLAQEAVRQTPLQGAFWTTLGVAHLRAAHWQPAIEALDKAMMLRHGGNSADWFFLAMAHWQLGQKDEARKWYDQAVEWMEKHKPQDDELRRFRAEAAALLGLPEPVPAPGEEAPRPP